MSDNGKEAPVSVMIFGEEYRIRTELGEDYTRSCAKYVDDAIQEAHVGGHITEPHRAAILAALKITDELFKAKRDADAMSEAIEARVTELAAKLEALSGAEAGEPAELSLDV